MADERAKLVLLGPFRLLAAHGKRIEITSKRGCALLAMLAMSNHGERTRGWLQDRLWGSRERQQAQNSLRAELSALRRQLNGGAQPLLGFTGDRVTLDLEQVEIDARCLDTKGSGAFMTAEFLEGIDIPGEEGFEDWLREQRAAIVASLSRTMTLQRGQAPETSGFHRTPSLAVLPFTNQTGDPDKSYLAEGIGEEVIDRMSRLRWLPVISPGPMFRPHPDETIQSIGQRLSSAYVVGGVLREGSDGYRLAAQVVETTTGQVIWSQRLPMPAPHASNAMASFVAELVAMLEMRVDHAEQVRARAQPETALSVNDLIWRGRWHVNRLSRDDSIAAERYFTEAMRQAPNSPIAIIEYTQHLAYQLWARRETGARVHQMRALAQRAIVLDYENARGHMLAGTAEMWLRNAAAAKSLLKRSIEINPSLSLAYEQLATLYNMMAEPAAALEAMQIAIRLGPSDYRLFAKHGEFALAHLLTGDYNAAAHEAEQALILRPGYWHAQVMLINALARSGQAGAAAQAMNNLSKSRPRFAPDYIDWIPFVETRWNDFLKEGLATAFGA